MKQEKFEMRRSQRRWPVLSDDALYGVLGKIVSAIQPHTEADPAAILMQLLVAFGNIVGRGPHCVAEADRHGMNLNVIIVGETAKARKGTSLGYVRKIAREIDEDWLLNHTVSGLSSGEGLILRVADQTTAGEDVDKRLCVIETEFANVTKVMVRTGNTLSVIVRQAWDGVPLHVLTRNEPLKATDAHISIIGHITQDELHQELKTNDAANGFANRFLFCLARRSKSLPEGGKLDPAVLDPLIAELKQALTFARSLGDFALTRDEEARQLWRKVYEGLAEGLPGLLGAVTSRAEAQVQRLSALYALLDSSRMVRVAHLRAAMAVWRYAEASARYIFGSALGNRLADQIYALLRESRDGLSRTDISAALGRHTDADDIQDALALLYERQLAEAMPQQTGGRSKEVWRVTRNGNQHDRRASSSAEKKLPSSEVPSRSIEGHAKKAK